MEPHDYYDMYIYNEPETDEPEGHTMTRKDVFRITIPDLTEAQIEKIAIFLADTLRSESQVDFRETCDNCTGDFRSVFMTDMDFSQYGMGRPDGKPDRFCHHCTDEWYDYQDKNPSPVTGSGFVAPQRIAMGLVATPPDAETIADGAVAPTTKKYWRNVQKAAEIVRAEDVDDWESGRAIPSPEQAQAIEDQTGIPASMWRVAWKEGEE